MSMKVAQNDFTINIKDFDNLQNLPNSQEIWAK